MSITRKRRRNLGNNSIDLTGQRFGNLLVLDLAEGRTREGGLRWLCQCQCGHQVVFNGALLRTGHAKRCPHCVEYRKRLEPTEARARGVYRSYKHRAKRREIVFDLTREEFVALALEPCHYCGAIDFPNGIDRVDNDQGYTLGNTVSCCKVCNRAKNTMDYDNFLAWLDQVVLFHTQGES